MSAATAYALSSERPESSGTSDDAGLTDALRFVTARLEAAVLVTGTEGREAMAMSIFEEVTRFVLDWQEGTVRPRPRIAE